MLDLFCGRGGWTNAFLARGWQVTGVDIVQHPDYRGDFLLMDAREVKWQWVMANFDFGCASSPCENFSIHGMPMFHPEPPYPFEGIELFNHTRALFERAKMPYVMENVRPAEKFVGNAAAHCGPFYLWGSAVPMLLPQGIKKGMKLGGSIKFGDMPIEERRKHRTQDLMLMAASGSPERLEWTSKVATIPPELANCVADYAERLLETRATGEARCQQP